MAKYIEKSMMKQYIKNFCQGLIEDNRRFDPVDDCALLCDVVNFAPAADVVEVKHGRWIEKETYLDIYYDCSICGESFCFLEGSPTDNSYKYCPNCGAKMDGERKAK